MLIAILELNSVAFIAQVAQAMVQALCDVPVKKLHFNSI